jgi:hypothetical protein
MRGWRNPAMVDGMSSPQEPYSDPSGNTEAFQAFVNRGGVPEVKPGGARHSSTALIVGIVIAVIVVAIVVWLAVS